MVGLLKNVVPELPPRRRTHAIVRIASREIQLLHERPKAQFRVQEIA